MSADGREYLSWGADQRLVWGSTAARDRRVVLPRTAGAGVTAMAFAPAARVAVVGTTQGVAELWDLETSTERRRWSDHSGAIRCVAWSADGSRFATAGDDAVVRVREAETGNLVAALTGHAEAVRHLVFSRDGRRLASEGGDRAVKIWDLGERRQLLGRPVLPGRVLDLRETDRGFVMATQLHAKLTLVLERLEDPGGAVEIPYSSAVRLSSGRFSADGRRFFGARDRTLMVWEASEGVLLLTLNDAVPAPFSGFDLSADQRCLVAGDRQGASRSSRLPGAVPVNSAGTWPGRRMGLSVDGSPSSGRMGCDEAVASRALAGPAVVAGSGVGDFRGGADVAMEVPARAPARVAGSLGPGRPRWLAATSAPDAGGAAAERGARRSMAAAHRNRGGRRGDAAGLFLERPERTPAG
ncbi:MAG: hypothetical protein M5U12_01265 [Verrucomicrobia bacterium]|nr:hypothetical protein [Verrucomicrobiota bacterium]